MCYSSVIQSKNGEEIPIFCNGKPMHSKYNPSAEKLLADCSSPEGFFLIGGIGGGYHILNLTRQLKNYFIIAFESDEKALAFCMGLKSVQELLKNPRIKLCKASDVQNLVKQRYLAALYGNFSCIFQRAWQKENEETCEKVEKELKATLKAISADFSVQAHFGKIWMHNILVNLKHSQLRPFPELGKEQLDKCAAVIAAGPSLDKSKKQLQEKRAGYFIIATDTTAGPLYRSGIRPDAIISVDAQVISAEHFYPVPSHTEKNKAPLVFLDLCTCPSTSRMLEKRGIPPFFFQSGHPLSQLAAKDLPIPRLETGSGTVTIAAADLARNLGFKRIRLFGADFSYRNGKPYTKGSYLDSRFGIWSNALFSAEQQFTALMYRTPLKETGKGIFTSEILDSYRESLEDWTEKHGYNKKLDELHCQNAEKQKGSFCLSFDFKSFIKKCLQEMEQNDDIDSLSSSETFYALLPYMAWLRQHPISDMNNEEQESLNLFRTACDFAKNFGD
ncbi:MAG: DUF115 domain-containing protein [Treponema sp.]|nr:DUF115 domain-containing protein [Treponema sp.]